MKIKRAKARNKQEIKPKVVGVALPPRDERGRLLPGQSLNPTGLKKGTRHMATLLKDAITKISNEEGTKIDKQIVMALYHRAVKGDIRAIEMVFDRVDGKPLQEIDLTSGGETIGMSPEQRAKLDELINQ
jgi:hypothetical protein